MTPPPSAALALLGVWVLLTLWATSTAATNQARADGRLERVEHDDRLDQSADGASEFPADD